MKRTTSNSNTNQHGVTAPVQPRSVPASKADSKERIKRLAAKNQVAIKSLSKR